MNRALPSIRRLLLTLALACVVPVALLSFGLITYHYQRERAQIEAGTVATARALMANVDERLLGVQLALMGLAKSPQLAAGDLRQFREEALALTRAGQVRNIVLLDAGGHQVMNTRVDFGSPLPAEVHPQMFEPVRTGKPMAMNLFRTPIGNQLMVGLGIPVQAGGAGVYGINANIEPIVLEAALRRQKLPPGWIAAVLDGNGVIVARTHDHDRYLGTPARPALVQRIREVPEDAVESVTVDGVPVVTAFSRSPQSGWSIAIGIPRAELAQPMRESMWLWLAGTAAVLLLTAWLARRLARRVAGSIEALGAAVRGIGHGTHLSLPAPAFLEAEQLGQTFLHATAALHDADMSLQRSEERLSAILDTATDAIVTANEHGHIVLVNKAALNMFGLETDEALARPLDLLIPGVSRQAPQAGPQVLQLRRADGSSFPAEASISVTHQEEGRLFTVILRDITERERQKAALVHSNLELQQFAFVASHDLRAPLKSIVGFMNMLASRHANGLGPAGLALIARAQRAAVRMDLLTHDLLAYARLDGQSRSPEPVDCGAAAADALALLKDEVRACGARVHIGPLPTVTGYRTQLVRLFQNLLDNALKYNAGAPEIAVAAQRQGDEWVFSVRDNGIGIEEKYLGQIFDVFKRLHTEREYPGTGMGLAVCRRVVERHGGRIWVTSQPGQGSTFFFSLPAT